MLQAINGVLYYVSHPSRGAWIEIIAARQRRRIAYRRTPRGVRGLKCIVGLNKPHAVQVAPLAGCVD